MIFLTACKWKGNYNIILIFCRRESIYQWQNTWLAYTRFWDQSQKHTQKKKISDSKIPFLRLYLEQQIEKTENKFWNCIILVQEGVLKMICSNFWWEAAYIWDLVLLVSWVAVRVLPHYPTELIAIKTKPVWSTNLKILMTYLSNRNFWNYTFVSGALNICVKSVLKDCWEDEGRNKNLQLLSQNLVIQTIKWYFPYSVIVYALVCSH